MRRKVLLFGLLVGCSRGPRSSSEGVSASDGRAEAPSSPHASSNPSVKSEQLVLAVARSWNSTTADLRRFERVAGALRRVGGSSEVELGRAGLGWGRGLHPPSLAGPRKREGDGRSPAGLFRFGTAFGAAEGPSNLRWPYLRTTATLRCVDDPAHPDYGALLETNPPPAVPFRSAETMQPTSRVYDLGLVVEHNLPAEPGAGSCIFVHLATSERRPTSGCTALDRGSLEALLDWLAPEKTPLFVQLPASELAFAEAFLELEPGALRGAEAP